jgi:hypothetical protein
VFELDARVHGQQLLDSTRHRRVPAALDPPPPIRASGDVSRSRRRIHE